MMPNSIIIWKIFHDIGYYNLFLYSFQNKEILSIFTFYLSIYDSYCTIQFIMESQFKNCLLVVSKMVSLFLKEGDFKRF